MNTVAVILAGGAGMRLWPWSRREFPKQFLSLIGSECLFTSTLRRAAKIPGVIELLVILGLDQKFLAQRVIAECDFGVPVMFVVEPFPRNTAPAILLAACDVVQRHGDVHLAVLPADHLVTDQEGFVSASRLALAAVSQGELAIMGIKPSYAEPGFGYIETDDSGQSVRPLVSFIEKPDVERATQYVASGRHFWNAGMFFMGSKRTLDLFEAYQPLIMQAVTEYLRTGENDVFRDCPSLSFDYAVMEHIDSAVVVACDFGWSDLGSWSGVQSSNVRDADGNVCQGDVLAIECKNSLLYSDHRLVVGLGLDDIVVAETQDAILVAHQKSSQKVKKIVELLEEKGRSEAKRRAIEFRPWGSFTVLEDDPKFKVKRLDVLPGKRLSLQRHQKRTEFWLVVSGKAIVVIGDETLNLNTNDTATIPCGTIHRIENPGLEPLCIVEVQVGTYFGEDDIERFEDDFGRL